MSPSSELLESLQRSVLEDKALLESLRSYLGKLEEALDDALPRQGLTTCINDCVDPNPFVIPPPDVFATTVLERKLWACLDQQYKEAFINSKASQFQQLIGHMRPCADDTRLTNGYSSFLSNTLGVRCHLWASPLSAQTEFFLPIDPIYTLFGGLKNQSLEDTLDSFASFFIRGGLVSTATGRRN